MQYLIFLKKFGIWFGWYPKVAKDQNEWHKYSISIFSFSFQSLNFIKWGYIDEVIFYLLLFTNFIILICLAKNQNAMYSSMEVYEHILDLMILNNFYSYVYTYYFQFQYINILNSF
jgi:hypothetical protein